MRLAAAADADFIINPDGRHSPVPHVDGDQERNEPRLRLADVHDLSHDDIVPCSRPRVKVIGIASRALGP